MISWSSWTSPWQLSINILLHRRKLVPRLFNPLLVVAGGGGCGCLQLKGPLTDPFAKTEIKMYFLLFEKPQVNKLKVSKSKVMFNLIKFNRESTGSSQIFVFFQLSHVWYCLHTLTSYHSYLKWTDNF